MDKSDEVTLIVTHLIETWSELTKCVMQNPEKLTYSQLRYWQDYQNLFQNDASMPPTDFDRRFKHEEWQNNVSLNFIKKSYLLLSKHIENLIDDTVKDKKMAKKIKFFSRQHLDAVAPSNFANINPEVLEKINKTQGENLIAGFRQFLEDIEYGKGQLNIQTTDVEQFEIGENIACTPGKIIYQNDLMQLIQYTRTIDKTYPYPILIIPPWINKYYILDLQQENSLVKWLVDQGFSVFMISWVNPTSKHRKKRFVDYMLEGPLEAFKYIKKTTGENKLHIVGYCIGGTLLGCMLAYLAKKKDRRVISATFLTTLLDFSEPGELGVFTDERQIKVLEKHMKSKGYLDGRIMTAVFNALRANDLIWASFINNYLMGEKPKPFDLLYWNSDATHIPEKVHRFYLRNMYLKNALIKKNKIKFAGVPIDLNKINVPSYFLAAKDDHIVPWESCYKSSQLLGRKTRFVLTSSGHVAGVVNPPQRKKYGFWVDNTNTYIQGSWWNDWVGWLKKQGGKLKSSTKRRIKKQESLEDAPGSYVKVKIVDR